MDRKISAIIMIAMLMGISVLTPSTAHAQNAAGALARITYPCVTLLNLVPALKTTPCNDNVLEQPGQIAGGSWAATFYLDGNWSGQDWISFYPFVPAGTGYTVVKLKHPFASIPVCTASASILVESGLSKTYVTPMILSVLYDEVRVTFKYEHYDTNGVLSNTLFVPAATTNALGPAGNWSIVCTMPQ
ncbi:hypothetical protein [Luteibacter yeojuensis]